MKEQRKLEEMRKKTEETYNTNCVRNDLRVRLSLHHSYDNSYLLCFVLLLKFKSKQKEERCIEFRFCHCLFSKKGVKIA